ncbi:MAG: 3-oxoacyl-[acyl-carrier protein] reductase [Gammaproteobacteria bacterium]|jgi:ketoreductase RED2|nr:3-oxoacyl-[acyl-carrier protein] reductase [Gammaproteobacteria bacterium]
MTTLQDKVAIVTGSTSGIGEAIARLLAASGVKVVINSVKSIKKGAAIVAVLDDSIYCQANIAIEDDCKNLIYSAIKKYGRLDFLINNAGAIGRLPSNDINIITNELFLETLNINVVGTWCLTRHAIPYLQKSGDGVIINITSCAGSDPGAVSSAMPYAVAKSAINYLTKLLAKELGPSIRVNAVAPGLILTPRTEDFSVAIEKFENRTPLKRVGEPNDIAELVIAIIKSNYINGEIIVADGGFSVV